MVWRSSSVCGHDAAVGVLLLRIKIRFMLWISTSLQKRSRHNESSKILPIRYTLDPRSNCSRSFKFKQLRLTVLSTLRRLLYEYTRLHVGPATWHTGKPGPEHYCTPSNVGMLSRRVLAFMMHVYDVIWNSWYSLPTLAQMIRAGPVMSSVEHSNGAHSKSTLCFCTIISRFCQGRSAQSIKCTPVSCPSPPQTELF